MSVYPEAAVALLAPPVLPAVVRQSGLYTGTIGPQDEPSALVPSVGIASTPDNAVFTIGGPVRFEAKVTYNADNTGVLQTIASNRTSSTPVAFHFRIVNGSLILLLANAAGSTLDSNALGLLATALPGLVAGETIYVRADVEDVPTGNVRVTGYASRNGTTWTALTTPRTAAATFPLYNGTDPLRIGQYGTAPDRYLGNILWAKMETLKRAWLVFPGVVNHFVSTPNLWTTGGTGQTVEIMLRVSANWLTTPADIEGWVFASNRWGLRRSSVSQIQFYSYGNDGTASTASATIPVGWTNGQMVWLRATNNATTLTWEWAADSDTVPTSWTQLRTPLAATTPGLRLANAPLMLGTDGISANGRMAKGRIARLIIRDTIGGTNLIDMSENDAATMTGSTYVAHSGQVFTVSNPISPVPFADGVLASITSPDSAADNIVGDIRVTARVRDDSAESGAARYLVVKGSGVDYAYALLSTFTTVAYAGLGWPTGVTTTQVGHQIGTRTQMGLTPPGSDLYYGANIRGVNPAVQTLTCTAQGLRSTDGVTWTNAGTPGAAIRADGYSRDSAIAQRIGSGFVGRIYWIQVENLDGAGNPTTVRWRFDAAEAAAAGTLTYTDPRGRQWTLSAPISPANVAPLVQPQPAQTIWRFDAAEYASVSPYTDPRGLVWTVTNAAIARAVTRPVTATVELRGGLT